MRILLADDHAELLDLVSGALQRDGHVVVAVKTATEAARCIHDEEFEVLVLDEAFPDGSGRELCRAARSADIATPILLLTAHASVDKRVEGLDAGADDFMAKPFAMAELRARVRALGRRKGLPAAYTWDGCGVSLDFARRRAFAPSGEVALTAREWGILEVLASARGRVVPRSRILAEVWGDAAGAEASLEVLVGRVRKKLGDRVVRTVRGEGYALGE